MRLLYTLFLTIVILSLVLHAAPMKGPPVDEAAQPGAAEVTKGEEKTKVKPTKIEGLLNDYEKAVRVATQGKLNEREKGLIDAAEKDVAEKRRAVMNHGRISNTKAAWLIGGATVAAAVTGGVIGSATVKAFS